MNIKTPPPYSNKTAILDMEKTLQKIVNDWAENKNWDRIWFPELSSKEDKKEIDRVILALREKGWFVDRRGSWVFIHTHKLNWFRKATLFLCCGYD